MYGSMSWDVNRGRMQDRMRAADAYRMAKETRAARAHDHRTGAKRVARIALTTLLWPVKH